MSAIDDLEKSLRAVGIDLTDDQKNSMRRKLAVPGDVSAAAAHNPSDARIEAAMANPQKAAALRLALGGIPFALV